VLVFAALIVLVILLQKYLPLDDKLFALISGTKA
jgi:hypothetical protein